jgi:hypothetical protein
MSQSTRPGSAKMDSTMRGTFYSEEREETQIVDTFKLSNVLELSEQEKGIISEIQKIMNEECEQLQADIDEVQA